MSQLSYQQRRGEIEKYFDRTAAEAWARLTSDAPVSRIRATVRAGRDDMRETLLSWLPADLAGKRVLDAGCGTGMLSVEAARRGAEVVAIDLSPRLVELAGARIEATDPDLSDQIEFTSGDMLDDALGRFDYVVAMDSLIHYQGEDIVAALAKLLHRTNESLVFTFAPGTSLLKLMHKAGKLFPKSDRSPAIVPIHYNELCDRLLNEFPANRVAASERQIGTDQVGTDQALSHQMRFAIGRDHRVSSGFYKSHALELCLSGNGNS